MRIVTSIAPHRIERQKCCVDTWQRHTKDIISINTQSEIDQIQPHFPNISFRNLWGVGDGESPYPCDISLEDIP